MHEPRYRSRRRRRWSWLWIIAGDPGGQRDLQAVQDAFNQLRQQSGRPLCQLSALLALSINPQS